jgi:hypothetical protein
MLMAPPCHGLDSDAIRSRHGFSRQSAQKAKAGAKRWISRGPATSTPETDLSGSIRQLGLSVPAAVAGAVGEHPAAVAEPGGGLHARAEEPRQAVRGGGGHRVEHGRQGRLVPVEELADARRDAPAHGRREEREVVRLGEDDLERGLGRVAPLAPVDVGERLARDPAGDGARLGGLEVGRPRRLEQRRDAGRRLGARRQPLQAQDLGALGSRLGGGPVDAQPHASRSGKASMP